MKTYDSAEMTAAEKTVNNNGGDIADLMNALNETDIEPEQDYGAETTTWTFGDGSFIRIQGTSVETG